MIVFLDLDGVLANFDKAACPILNVSYPPSDWHWDKGILDGFRKVDEKCNIDFWINLDWMLDGKEILQVVESYFEPKNIYLLTAPMLNPGSGTGKMLWVKNHLPQYYEQLIITRAPKHLLAKPDTLLIDDKDENVEGFWDAGGKAILVPRHWNRFYAVANSAVKSIKTDFEAIMEGENGKNSCGG